MNPRIIKELSYIFVTCLCCTVIGYMIGATPTPIRNLIISVPQTVNCDDETTGERGENHRSSNWPKVEKQHRQLEPCCAVCGRKDSKTDPLQVHHILDFKYFPELELEDSNLITLCQHDHFVWGHLLHWKTFNPDIRKQIDKYHEWVKDRPIDKTDYLKRWKVSK